MLIILLSQSSKATTVVTKLKHPASSASTLHQMFSHASTRSWPVPGARWLIQGEWLSLVTGQMLRVNKLLRSWRKNLLYRSWGHPWQDSGGPSLPTQPYPEEPEQNSGLPRVPSLLFWDSGALSLARGLCCRFALL